MNFKQIKDQRLLDYQKKHVDRIKWKLRDEPEILGNVIDALDLMLWGHYMEDKDFERYDKLMKS